LRKQVLVVNKRILSVREKFTIRYKDTKPVEEGQANPTLISEK
jgi:hypothetical protein